MFQDGVFAQNQDFVQALMKLIIIELCCTAR